MSKSTIIISGGTGLVGSAIVQQLVEEGKSVTILTTRKNPPQDQDQVKYSHWNPTTGSVDHSLFSKNDTVINLAGANLAERWSKNYKQVILNSRIDSTQLLVEASMKEGSTIQHFVSTSAVGYYPCNQKIHREEDPPGTGFLSEVCKKWENSAKPINDSNIKLSILRIGVVLSKEGGALKKLLPLFKMGLGSAVGKGSQAMATIHIEDLSRVFCQVINESWQGIYNAVGPEPSNNASFSKQLAQVMEKPFFLPKVPSFVLKMVLGEMSTIILEGQNASAAKLTNQGFQFKYPSVKEQLSALLNE